MYMTGNTYQTGSHYLTGDVILSGSINIGDNVTGDTINFNGEVNSNILPTTGATFNLGSSGKTWNNIFAENAYLSNLEIDNITLNSLSLPGNLTVSGTTTLSGSVYVEDLIEKRLVVAGAGGLLTNYSGLTFNNGNLNVSGALEVTNIQGTGSLYLRPDKADGRYFEIYNTAASDVHIKSSNGLSFFGDDTNYLKIDDYAQTATIVGTNGVFISSSLSVTGSGTFTNNLNVSGDTTTVGSQYINSNLFVGGNGKVTGSFEVVGATSLDSTLTVTGSVTLKDNLSVSGTTTIDGLTTINDSAVVNGVLTVTGNTQLQSNLYVSGNLEVLGSSTNVIIQSQTIELDDNIIRLNAYSPFQRYAGFEVIDSGSSGVSASMVWDSQNDYWMFVSSSGLSSKFIGTTAAAYGSETSLTDTYFPIATGPNTMGDSLLRYSGTTLSFNTNKFTVDSGNGDTMVSGNFTLSYSGGTDNGTKTSAILFRNSSNVVGFVTTTETEDVMDGILGYKHTGGGLVFSTVIDGGTY